MPEARPIFDRPCSKCGIHVVLGDRVNTPGDLADHRLCVVPVEG